MHETHEDKVFLLPMKNGWAAVYLADDGHDKLICYKSLGYVSMMAECGNEYYRVELDRCNRQLENACRLKKC